MKKNQTLQRENLEYISKIKHFQYKYLNIFQNKKLKMFKNVSKCSKNLKKYQKNLKNQKKSKL